MTLLLWDARSGALNLCIRYQNLTQSGYLNGPVKGYLLLLTSISNPMAQTSVGSHDAASVGRPRRGAQPLHQVLRERARERAIECMMI